jgi:hypothetical protein
VPEFSPVVTIDLSGVKPASVSDWKVYIYVDLKMPDGSKRRAGAGEVSVNVQDRHPVTDALVKDYGTQDTDAEGKTVWTLPGAFYVFPSWWPHFYKVFAKHKATGAQAGIRIKLDAQIPDTGTIGGWWAPPWSSDAERTAVVVGPA